MNAHQIIPDCPLSFRQDFFEKDEVSCSLIQAPLFHQLLSHLYPQLAPPAQSVVTQLTLSFLQLLTSLKGHEFFGLYITHKDLSFRYHLEVQADGHYRFLVTTAEQQDLPETFTGTVKIHFFSLSQHQPYTSILSYDQIPYDQLINEIIKQSIQSPSQVLVLSNPIPASLLLKKSPPRDGHVGNLETHQENSRQQLQSFIQQSHFWPHVSLQDYEKAGATLLDKKELHFHCDCQKEKFFEAFLLIYHNNPHDLFLAGETSIQGHCEYCKTSYTFDEKDFLTNSDKI
jgi:hypothetical protein